MKERHCVSSTKLVHIKRITGTLRESHAGKEDPPPQNKTKSLFLSMKIMKESESVLKEMPSVDSIPRLVDVINTYNDFFKRPKTFLDINRGMTQ